MRLRRSKYNNRKVKLDGYLFDSAKEARRYQELKLMYVEGLIKDLSLQHKFVFYIDGKYIFSYLADFVYKEGSRIIVEDVKGFKTPLYRLKKKLIEAQYKITIIEITWD